MSRAALLVLADGSVFRGTALGADGEAIGEVVFNTGLTGYQEVLTDPSYHGQIVTMTYPHQGNYGLNDLDAEAGRPHVRGFVVKAATERPSSWRSEESLDDYLLRHGVVAISGIDTRKLTRRLRSDGAAAGVVSSVDGDVDRLVAKVREAPGLVGRDLVREVTPAEAYDADAAELLATGGLERSAAARSDVAGARVAAIDFGMKRNILRSLVVRGFTVRVFPASATGEEVLAWAPDGVFLSNGPGDPEPVDYAVKAIREVLRAGLPTFGICLGHQLLGRALGGETYKLKFGHRGANHPVKSLRSGSVEITTQNHGFALSLGPDLHSAGDAWRRIAEAGNTPFVASGAFGDIELTHYDLNDGTLEGLRCLDVPAYSVQYHPEAAPGPHDAQYLFDEFAELIAARGPARPASR